MAFVTKKDFWIISFGTKDLEAIKVTCYSPFLLKWMSLKRFDKSNPIWHLRQRTTLWIFFPFGT